jgi:hypothetical protein
MKIRPVGADADGQTDRHTNSQTDGHQELIVAFRSFWIAPNKVVSPIVYTCARDFVFIRQQLHA